LTEEISDVELVLFASQTILDKSLELRVIISVNTAITNRVTTEGLSDAELVTASGKMLARAKVSGNNAVFEKVLVFFPATQRTANLRIRRLMVNASGLGQPSAIVAGVDVEGSGIRIARPSNDFPIVAIPGPGLQFSGWTPKGAVPIRLSGFSPGTNAEVRLSFAEAFPRAFQVPNDDRVGTQLKVIFFDIPPAISIWVGIYSVASPGIAYLLAEQPSRTPMPATAIHGGFPVVQLQTSARGPLTAEATWQVLAPLPSDVRSYDFLCVIKCDATLSEGLQRVSALGLLAPNATSGQFTPTTGATASATLPIPRYSIVGAQRLTLLEIEPLS
jgi:hypothetical protein